MAIFAKTYLVGQGGASSCTSTITTITYHHGAGLCGCLFLEEDIMDNRLIGPKPRASRCTAGAATGPVSGHARSLKSEVSFETQPNSSSSEFTFGLI